MEKNNAAALLDDIFAKALDLRASDVHLEPREQFLRVRFRVDGLLREGKPIHKAQQNAVLSRLKVLFDLDIAETRVPQDGRANLNSLDIRASIIPTLHGEKAVLRLLDRKQTGLDLEELGMEADDLACYKRMIARRSGIILVTGPTGSGKTTTLYATLAALNHKELNITTIEDPVEYQLPGINQIQVNNKAGLTFANGLRSILRQDPDILMVGEIRDLETAKIAFQAALTGHLVFSTLHTGDAAEAMTRLTDLGIERYLVEAAVIGVLAQRLVRKVSANGWSGRTAVYELLPGASAQGNRRNLMANGQLKVKSGMTTEEELARVIALES